MTASTSRQSFWTSKEVSCLITDAMKLKNPRWKPTPGIPAWRDLRAEIIRANSKDTSVVPPPLFPPRGYCIDQLPFPKGDDAGNYLRFRYYLGVVADLLSLLRQRIEQGQGNEAWRQASMNFQEDAEKRTLFLFLREVSAAPRPQAVHCLESVSKRGLVIKWPGNVRSGFWSRDCGLETFVHMSQSIFSILGNGQNNDAAEGTTHRKHVTVKSAGPNLVELRYEGRLVQLGGNRRVLFLHLFWNKDRAIPYKDLWTLLYPKKIRYGYTTDRRGGPPDCLRRTKADLEKKLRGRFGLPKGRRFWIDPHPGCGYRLNVASVDWQVAVGSMDYPLFTRDQSNVEDHGGDR